MNWFTLLFMGVYGTLLFILGLYGIHRYWILYLYYRHYKWAKPRAIPDLPDPLPVVTVQLPLYNERYVAERLIDSVAQLAYPRDRLEIQVLDDSTDDTSQIVLEKINERLADGFDVKLIRRSRRVGFKAGALAEGLACARGQFLAIFDADFLPPSDFLMKTLPHFSDAAIGMVQTRWGHLNEDHSLLTWIQSIFLDGHFLLEHTARNRSGAFFNFNGTAGIWRREAIENSGGWQHDTLTEDLDLSYRAQMRGWKFIFLPDVVCPAELPVDIHAFKTQQNRWTMGAIQTARKMLPTIWNSPVGWKVKVEATFHLTACAGYLMMVLLSVLMPLTLYFRARGQWPITGELEGAVLVSTIASIGMFYAVCQRDLYPQWMLRLRNLPLMIAVGTGMCLSNSKAILRGLWARDFEFTRTPKYSVVRHDASWKSKKYRTGNFGMGWLEAIFALYFLGAIHFAIQTHQWFSLPFLALFGYGYAYVAALTLLHGLTSWSPPAFLNTLLGKPVVE